MSYRRHFELLAGFLLVTGGCTDEFPEQANSLVSNDGVYLVTLDLPPDGMHAGEPGEMEFSVEHDGELIEVEMPELHFEQHSGGSASGSIDLEAGHMHGRHHAMHTFATAGDYVLSFSFVAEHHDEEEADAAAAHDEDGGDEAAHEEGDAGVADHAAGERSEHEFEIAVQEADHAHADTAHADDGHMH